ncbi:MAG: hypothetical protein AAFU85_28160, partial [Planctomycetota bacterium]
MWPTTRGMRLLDGAEGRLVLGAIGMMVDRLVAEARDETDPVVWGIDWFDQWDVGQRLWLLESVTTALFSSATLEPAAIFDATVDTIFLEIRELVDMELDEPNLIEGRSWRSDLAAALKQHGGKKRLDDTDDDRRVWSRAVSAMADAILGVRNYQRAESFRDHAYERTCAFLRDRGLPEDYLSKLPPLRSIESCVSSTDLNG